MSKQKSRRLVLALPSKGTLQDQTVAFLAACGLSVQLGGSRREYRGRLRGLPQIEVILLRADEIPSRVDEGGADLGITGEDLFRENTDGSKAAHLLLAELGYGHARLVTAVPRTWLDVACMADLEEVALVYRQQHGHSLRVATKYPRLTRGFFAQHGIMDYVIVPSLGATEGAPASGSADIIVDITSTGTTLVENHLKTVAEGTLLASQACLIASLGEQWTKANLAVLRQILDLMEGYLRARSMFTLRFRAKPSTISDMEHALRSAHHCDILAEGTLREYGLLFERNGAEMSRDITLHCPADQLYPVVQRLQRADCGEITATRVDYIFQPSCAAYDRFCHLQRRLEVR